MQVAASGKSATHTKPLRYLDPSLGCLDLCPAAAASTTNHYYYYYYYHYYINYFINTKCVCVGVRAKESGWCKGEGDLIAPQSKRADGVRVRAI